MAIIFYPTRKDGFGDLSIMVSLANLLANLEEKHYEIVMVSNDKDLLIEKFDCRKFLVLTIPQAESLIENNQLIPSLIIEGPTYIREHLITQKNSQNIVPSILVSEYGDSEVISSFNRALNAVHYANSKIQHGETISVLFAGLTKGKLVDAGGRFRVKTKLKLRKDDDGILMNSELIKKGGSFLENPISHTKSVVDNLSENIKNIVKEFLFIHDDDLIAQNSYFYYGHRKQTFEAFIKFIVAKNCGNNKNINLFAIGRGGQEGLSQHLEEFLKAHGFTVNSKVAERNINIISLKDVPHDDFINLMSISDTVAAVTGDQSFTEALNLCKVPFYEIRGHKLMFYRGLISLINDYNCPHLLKVLELIHPKDDIENINAALLDNNMANLSEEITPDLMEKCQLELKYIVEQINENWNLSKIFIERVESLLSAKPYIPNQPIIDKLIAEIERIQSIISEAAHLTRSENLINLRHSYCLMANRMSRTNEKLSDVIPCYFPDEKKIPKFIIGLLREEAEQKIKISFETDEEQLSRWHKI